MCRLLGLIANKEVDLKFSLLEGTFTLETMSKTNVDGWGLGWYKTKRKQPNVVKEPIPAYCSDQYRNASAEARSRIFIGHVRKATTGRTSAENCHPFSWDCWLFAHNGSVDRDALVSLLETSRREALGGETDSEVYFHWILQNILNKGGAEEGIEAALREVRKHSHMGLNFILTDGSRLYAYREAARSLNYYSLYYLLRDPRPEGPVSFRSQELGTLLESKSLNNEKAVLVCSEKLTEEEWQEIPAGVLLVVTSDLKPRLESMR
jgi:predicted glutamine amidotransferase